MCGFVGEFGYSIDAPSLAGFDLPLSRDWMIPRGPDGHGLWHHPSLPLGLAHRRLAIIDRSDDGLQPMASADASIRIVFNGEIYNYRDLRAELQGTGAEFRTQTDTEVLLHLYQRYGADMCSRLRGMFAFALWDERQRRLLLARDPYGIKPLYIHDDGHTVRFASQVKALLAGGLRPAVEPAGLVGFWLWGHVPEPWTMYEGITALPPGHCLQIDTHGRRTEHSFADLAEWLAPGHDEGGLPDLRQAITDSIRHHLIADVPVGVFLSSGIDSCTLAALAAESVDAVRTVTLGFEEYAGTPNDEVPLAEAVAARIGARHQTVRIAKRDFMDSIGQFLDSMDQPSIDGLNTWLVSRAAAQAGLKVAFSGTGGDELFGGYPSFRDIPKVVSLARPFAAMPGAGRALRAASAPLLSAFTSPKYASLAEYGGTYGGAYLLRRAVRLPWELERDGSIDPDLLRAGLRRLDTLPTLERVHSSVQDPRLKVSLLESTFYLRNQLLRDTDWAGMAHSLEIRVPFLDPQVTRAVGRLARNGDAPSKQDLAACARPQLPAEVTQRPKTGFTVPVRRWQSDDAGQDRSHSQGRGLRGWQSTVASAFGLL